MRKDPEAFPASSAATGEHEVLIEQSPRALTSVSKLADEYAEWAALLSTVGLRPHTLILRTNADRSYISTQTANLAGLPRIVLQAYIPAVTVPLGLFAVLEDAGTRAAVMMGTTESVTLIRALRSLPSLAPQKAASFNAALGLADRLMREIGVPVRAPDRQLYRATLARNLFDALTPQALAFLSAEPSASNRLELFNSGLLSPRGKLKVERLLRQPYTQAEAFARLDYFEALFRAWIPALKELAGERPYTLFLSGGAARGRYAPFSDFDLYVDCDDPPLRKAILRKEGLELSLEDRRAFQIGPARHPRSSVSLGDGTALLREEEGYFRRLFQERAQQSGLIVDLLSETSRLLPAAGELVEREPQSALDDLLRKAGPAAWPLRSRHQEVLNSPAGQWLTLERLSKLGGPVMAAARSYGYSSEALQSRPSRVVEWMSQLGPMERLALDWVLTHSS
ncbi:MAG: nucleotidyltransferase domain-containing protein [Myxococcaceae bacterium]